MCGNYMSESGWGFNASFPVSFVGKGVALDIPYSSTRHLTPVILSTLDPSPGADAVYVCHLDRSATEVLSHLRINGAEWRDPETVSSAMVLQGVLTKM